MNHQEATLGDVMAADEAITDAVIANHWISYHAGVRRAVELGLTDEHINDAYKRGINLAGPPDFVIPQATVTSRLGEETGWTFARCALCEWNEHGPLHDVINQHARGHRCPR
jgi:hypothetical protein